MSGFSNINGVNISVPKEFDGIIPVSPNNSFFAYEPFSFIGCKEGIHEGDIVFDLGVSYGIMTTLFAKLGGQVHSFEANASLFPMIELLASANDLREKVFLNNNIVCDESGREEVFYVIEGFQSVASSMNPQVIKKGGVPVKIKTICLDDYCKDNNIVPQFVKVDIEGAEYVALKGFSKTLEKYGPTLQIETHGEGIDGIGGSLEGLLSFLSDIGYSFYNLEEGKQTDIAEYIQTYRKRTGYIFASKALTAETLNRLDAASEKVRQQSGDIIKYRALLTNAREAVQFAKFDEVIELIGPTIMDEFLPAEAVYLYAFSLHQKSQQDGTLQEAACNAYNQAYERGFDEFWIRYNRAQLLLDMGKMNEANEDIEIAYELKPAHEGVQQLIKRQRDSVE